MKVLTKQVNMWINNQEVHSGDFYEIKDPGRHTDIVANVAKGTIENADHAVRAAHEAYLSWREMSVSERIQKVLTAIEQLEQSMPELCPLASREHGGLLSEAQTDFGYGVGGTQATAGIAEAYLAPQVFENESAIVEVHKKPRGVFIAIVPWNYPVSITMMKLAPGLISGNTAVVKPSPNSPAALTMALQRMAKVLPPGVINVVNGDGDVAKVLTTHPLVTKISFTGGTETAKHVMAAAASSIKKLTLELGGNDAAIILDDVNANRIMPDLVKGIFSRAGQICFAVKRVYVPQTIYRTFSNTLCEYVNEIKVGHGLDERSTMGAINNQAQYQLVKNLIDQSKRSNATVFELGKKVQPEEWDNGYYILPTVVRDIEHTADLSCNEQFGPVIPLIPYQSVEQAIEMANDSMYGLGSSVWSSDVDRAAEVARQVEAGFTFVNGHSIDKIDIRMPFGGVKQSGMGREFTEFGISEYIEPHAIRIR
ncbi:aldehyde dehydrogenase family protein [Neobacillus sp. NPDC097160]|uniref:aldehyde dehydrogenase family protein n=1 Tax=Neobacillus sp. NPDC097160 TaxID=3364298 RepID=UPI0038196658